MFADALLLLFEMADREDERFQAAAARWHARFVLEAGLPLREAEAVMTLLCRMRGTRCDRFLSQAANDRFQSHFPPLKTTQEAACSHFSNGSDGPWSREGHHIEIRE